jgi:hypothetical protein
MPVRTSAQRARRLRVTRTCARRCHHQRRQGQAAPYLIVASSFHGCGVLRRASPRPRRSVRGPSHARAAVRLLAAMGVIFWSICVQPLHHRGKQALTGSCLRSIPSDAPELPAAGAGGALLQVQQVHHCCILCTRCVCLESGRSLQTEVRCNSV